MVYERRKTVHELRNGEEHAQRAAQASRLPSPPRYAHAHAHSTANLLSFFCTLSRIDSLALSYMHRCYLSLTRPELPEYLPLLFVARNALVVAHR
jgi:hypothetical protein